MCKLIKYKGRSSKPEIDECMVSVIKEFKRMGMNTVACCCGHKKYPATVIVKINNKFMEIISGTRIPRQKRFYKKDKQGYYYIPEVVQNEYN